MRVRTFNAYFRQIDKLEARDEMIALRVARVAQSAGSGPVKDLMSELRRRIRGEDEKPQKIVIASPEEFNRIIRGT